MCVRSPYTPEKITRYNLDPSVVDCITFCTKNPGPMLPQMQLLSQFNQYWFVTVTPYGKEIEPGVGDKLKILEDVKALSKIVERQNVAWRYDPVFVDESYTVERHIRAFEKMAGILNGYVDTCIISFIDLFEKVKRNFPEVRQVTKEERLTLASAFVEITNKYGMTLKTCAEGDELAFLGIDCSGCMTMAVYEKACGYKLDAPVLKAGRKECACFLSCDIGQYDTCMHYCRYCYANNDIQNVKKNNLIHDPDSPLLVGNIGPQDTVEQAVQKSWKSKQLMLF